MYSFRMKHIIISSETWLDFYEGFKFHLNTKCMWREIYFPGVLFNRCLIENWGNHILPRSIQRKKMKWKINASKFGERQNQFPGYQDLQKKVKSISRISGVAKRAKSISRTCKNKGKINFQEIRTCKKGKIYFPGVAKKAKLICRTSGRAGRPGPRVGKCLSNWWVQHCEDELISIDLNWFF